MTVDQLIKALQALNRPDAIVFLADWSEEYTDIGECNAIISMNADTPVPCLYPPTINPSYTGHVVLSKEAD